MSTNDPTLDPQQPQPNLPGASDDLIAELQAKTAELAGKFEGTDALGDRVLEINDDPIDIFAELEKSEENQRSWIRYNPSKQSKLLTLQSSLFVIN